MIADGITLGNPVKHEVSDARFRKCQAKQLCIAEGRIRLNGLAHVLCRRKREMYLIIVTNIGQKIRANPSFKAIQG